MTEHNITELKGEWRGRDAWVIGSAKSMDYIDPGFFANKLTICINRTMTHFPCVIGIQNDWPILPHPDDCRLVLPRYNRGVYADGPLEFDGPCWRYDHLDNTTVIDDAALSVIGTDRLVVGKSTMAPAIHLAAYLGAANIMLCGHDGGLLDGKLQFDRYHPPWQFTEHNYSEFVKSIMGQTRAIRDRLRQVYGCRIYSLNPFVGLTTDGHQFQGA